MKRVIGLLLTGAFCFVISGCATIIHGTSTRLEINSDPEGALVTIGNQTAVTPTDMIVKNTSTRAVEFSKDGYESYVMYLDQQMSGWIWGNILFGGVIGLGIDVLSGGAYKLGPKNINVALQPKKI